MRAVLLCVVIAACGDDRSVVADAAPAELDATDASALTWESVETITDDGQIIVERVSYRSDGLRVFARVCRPVGADAHPVVIYNHGGFYGLALDPQTALCEQTARFGYVWIGSSYRGEDGSDGAVEVCLGEVTDVLRMIDVVLAQPYANRDRVAMWGASHGGCITTRAVQRGAPVHVAADVFGPADWGRLHAFWTARIAAMDPMAGFYQQLRGTLETAAGGTPAAEPAAYAERSPQNFTLPAATPFLIVHGTADPIVPVSESCALATGFSSYHLDANQAEVTSAPAGCAGLVFGAGPRPRPSWPGARYFVAYDGLGHEMTGTAGETMSEDLATFLMAKLP